MKTSYQLFFSLISSLFFSCGTAPSTAPNTTPNNTVDDTPLDTIDHSTAVFPYQLDRPDTALELVDELVEISGLSLTKDENLLVGVQDEKGYIYYINKESGAIEKEVKFWKNGDYEGVEVIGDRIFVLKNTGTLYELNTNEAPQELLKHKNFLTKADDVEGLGFDRKTNRLLLACKAKTSESKDNKLIYGFDLDSMQIIDAPVYEINLESIKSYLNQPDVQDKAEAFMKFFMGEEGELTFAPSGIAVHPITQDVYIISSVGKLLLILNQGGAIQSIHKLDKKIHRQPEGIAFAKDGTLYIANEGKKGKAKIIRYDYKE